MIAERLIALCMSPTAVVRLGDERLKMWRPWSDGNATPSPRNSPMIRW